MKKLNESDPINKALKFIYSLEDWYHKVDTVRYCENELIAEFDAITSGFEKSKEVRITIQDKG